MGLKHLNVCMLIFAGDISKYFVLCFTRTRTRNPTEIIENKDKNFNKNKEYLYVNMLETYTFFDAWVSP